MPPPVADFSFLLCRAAQKRIAAVALSCALAGGTYAFLAPKWYRSVVTLVPAKSQRGPGISSLLGADAAGLAAGLLDGAAGGADGARIAAVLQSVSVTDAVIDKFDLKTRYGESIQENVREELWLHCDVKVLPKPQLVQLSCEDKDPGFVQGMMTYITEHGNDAFRRVSVSSASEEVRFLEKHVTDLRRLADESAARMREFQETHRIVDLDSQAKAVVSAMATLNNQRIGKQLELDYARTFSANDEPSLQQLRSQLSVMAERLRDLEQAPDSSAPERSVPSRKSAEGLFPPALQVPRLRAEFERIYRERKVAEATLVFALERLESAKANEARNVSTFQVLDPPTLPTRKSRPKRALIIAMAMLLGFFVGVVREAWRAGAAQKLLGMKEPSPRARVVSGPDTRTA
jgi:capsule polysaccharide export protein KpsE/RkpR